MGMAASQARFLGLTARKSNVEYQGQQINQQRTALANESSNLYNQMLELEVPTPPSTNDFYETTYVMEDSANGLSSNYTIANIQKATDGSNTYRATLSTKIEHSQSIPSSYTFTPSEVKNADGSVLGGNYTFDQVASATIKLSENGKSEMLPFTKEYVPTINIKDGYCSYTITQLVIKFAIR